MIRLRLLASAAVSVGRYSVGYSRAGRSGTEASRRVVLASTVVPDHVELDARDAALIANYLFCLASLIDPDTESPHQLSEVQRRMLTNPPAHVITTDPRQMAGRLRDFVAAIHEQLGDDAPQL